MSGIGFHPNGGHSSLGWNYGISEILATLESRGGGFY